MIASLNDEVAVLRSADAFDELMAIYRGEGDERFNLTIRPQVQGIGEAIIR